MFAVIRYKGKQFQVEAGQQIKIDLQDAKPEDAIVFSEVLLVNDDKETLVGAPILEGAKVEGKILGPYVADKVVTNKFKNKTRYSRTIGHRQKYTIVEVKNIKC